ncbi:hypothetical protein ACSSV6_000223 [Roseovarius sp. MBR-38]
MARKKTTRSKNTDAPIAAEDGLTAASSGDTDLSQAPVTGDAPREDDAPLAVASSEEPPKAETEGVQDGPAPDTEEGTTEETAAPETDTPDTETTGMGAPPDTPTLQPEAAPEAEAVETRDEEMIAQDTGTAEETGAGTPERPAPVVRTEQVTVRQGGFWSMLLGGIAAAGIGVFAAPYLQPLLPPGWGVPGGATVDPARIDAQAGRIEDLEKQMSGLAIPPDLSGELEGLSQTLTGLTGQIADLENRVTDLAQRPATAAPSGGASDEAIAAFEDRLAAQRAEDASQQDAIEALRAEIAALRGEAEAQEAAARDSAVFALRRAALIRIRTALDTGEAFAPALTDLRETGADVPEPLTVLAETGAPTRARLVEGFPEAARAALAAARAEAGEGASVTGFLRSQLGVRSLTPREGDDADAVLSRAESALSQGRISDALAEIEALPQGARAAMADWAAEAKSRADALAAAEALSAAMN